VDVNLCPAFGQDRVNFHQTPGRGTAGTAGGWGLTPPGKTEPGIPYHVMSRWVPVGGSARWGLTCSWGARGAGAVRESGSVVRVWVVFSPYLYRCCYCFPLFAVLLNCPYPDPPFFCLFSFHSPPHRGRGRGDRVALLFLAAAETRTI